MTPAVETPASYAPRTLFEPIAVALRRFPDANLPTATTLTRMLHELAPGAATASGHAIRFTSSIPSEAAYEKHLYDTGEVATRPRDWHDFFNAMAWCAWPRAKAACNAAHLAEQHKRAATDLSGRGPRRDALTQFDECGLIVASSDAQIPRLLAAHKWEEVFWARREQLARTTRFLVFGHATWDQLRQPHFGLCAKAVHHSVSPEWLNLPTTKQLADADQWLAEWIARPQNMTSPRTLHPLPLLGIPGITDASECAEYYRDERQFRQPRAREGG